MNAEQRGLLEHKDLTEQITLEPSFEAQLLNYLRATDIEVGLLLNFGRPAQFKRLVFDNSRKHIREHPRRSAATSCPETGKRP